MSDEKKAPVAPAVTVGGPGFAGGSGASDVVTGVRGGAGGFDVTDETMRSAKGPAWEVFVIGGGGGGVVESTYGVAGWGDDHDRRRKARAYAFAPEMLTLLREVDEDAVCFNREREPCGECWPCRIAALLAQVDGSEK